MNNTVAYRYDENFEEFKKEFDTRLILLSYSDRLNTLLSKLYHVTISLSSSVLEDRNKYSSNDLKILDTQSSLRKSYEYLKNME